MKKIFTKEISIAVITLISLLLLYFGLNYMKGVNIFKPTNHYYVRLKNVNGLQKSSPVYVDGFRVGIVNSIAYDFEDQASDITLLISLDKKMKVETGSYIEMKSGLTSGGYLDLKLNKYVGTYCNVGDTLDGVSPNGIMEKLSDEIMPNLENILPRLDSILAGIQTLVSHPALFESLNQISATTANLENSTRQLDRFLSKDVPPIVSNLNGISADFLVMSNNLKQLNFDSSLKKIDFTLEGLNRITGQLNDKNNSLGLLLNDKSLYNHLDSTAVNASNLLLDLKLNPKRYVHFSLF